ncbi:MAG: bifunctional alpha,alpha-trehalose-phosphate synthase (UDP-forming)/trehalose-phosphatase [bacterium]
MGFFIHIPFPTFEIFRLLPAKWRSEILKGILGADLIGFHTYDYTQYFLRCILRILGYEHNMGTLVVEDRVVKIDTFPMGIDFKRFYNASSSIEVQEEIVELKKTLADFKVILSIDRLDYTKGIINRLQGYEIFLKNNPQWHGKVILVLVVVPSRIGVEHYQQMKRQIDELIGKINGRFGSVPWTPVLYQYRFLPFNPLVALYSISNVALITPLRDGMNLIAKEYISSRTDNKTGVLILSEIAGASKELREAMIINPNNREEIAGALKEALEMSKQEQARCIQAMQARLKRYDVVKWANEFIQSILSIREEQSRFETKLLGGYKEKLVLDFKKANHRLIFLDYDGTLVPFVGYPQMAKPGENILKIIKHLSEDEKNEIVLISGRDRNTLLSWFGMFNVGLVAEHGVWLKGKNEDWRMIKPLMNDWKTQILPILEMYVDRLPGSFVEEKEFSIVWHYRMPDPELGSILAKELIDYLVNFTANIDVQVLQGSKVVEIRNAGVNKGVAGLHWVSKNDFDFISAIGDDWTDEDFFKALPETAYSIRVGMSQSHARFNLHNYIEVIELLEQLVEKDGE